MSTVRHPYHLPFWRRVRRNSCSISLCRGLHARRARQSDSVYLTGSVICLRQARRLEGLVAAWISVSCGTVPICTDWPVRLLFTPGKIGYAVSSRVLHFGSRSPQEFASGWVLHGRLWRPSWQAMSYGRSSSWTICEGWSFAHVSSLSQ